MDRSKNDDYYTEKIKSHCQAIATYISGKTFSNFIQDDLLVDSVCFRLIQIAEDSGKLSEAFKEKHSEIPWKMVSGLRNHIVHDYGAIDKRIVFQTATFDIPLLLASL
jgi:uncharacterized protein with HEPN domain